MLYSLEFMSYYIELVNIAHPYITPFSKCPCPWIIELRVDQCKCRHQTFKYEPAKQGDVVYLG
jgi:hypothetical protein